MRLPQGFAQQNRRDLRLRPAKPTRFRASPSKIDAIYASPSKTELRVQKTMHFQHICISWTPHTSRGGGWDRLGKYRNRRGKSWKSQFGSIWIHKNIFLAVGMHKTCFWTHLEKEIFEIFAKIMSFSQIMPPFRLSASKMQKVRYPLLLPCFCRFPKMVVKPRPFHCQNDHDFDQFWHHGVTAISSGTMG